MKRDHPAAPHVPDDSEARRNRALARYDAHPGIAILLLAVMAVVVVAAIYQLVSNRFDRTRVTTAASHPPSPQHGQSAEQPDRVPRVGTPAFSLEGNKVGAVESVNTAPDGAVTAITVAVERQLGLGAKLVAIPMSKFTTRDEIVHIDLTASDIAALPDQGP